MIARGGCWEELLRREGSRRVICSSQGRIEASLILFFLTQFSLGLIVLLRFFRIRSLEIRFGMCGSVGFLDCVEMSFVYNRWFFFILWFHYLCFRNHLVWDYLDKFWLRLKCFDRGYWRGLIDMWVKINLFN